MPVLFASRASIEDKRIQIMPRKQDWQPSFCCGLVEQEYRREVTGPALMLLFDLRVDLSRSLLLVALILRGSVVEVHLIIKELVRQVRHSRQFSRE